MAAENNEFKRLPQRSGTEGWLKRFEWKGDSEALIEEAGKLALRDQVAFGQKPGRRAAQVTRGLGVEGVPYYYAGEPDPATHDMSDLKPALRELVEILMRLFKEETGDDCNNVLVQLYEPMTGIGEHADDSQFNRVSGWVLSYNGGASRRFAVRDDDGKRIKLGLEPGSAVMFKGGDRKHELEKPYIGAKKTLGDCRFTKNCRVIDGRYRCNRGNCPNIYHLCQCPHLRLNITLRHLEVIKRPIAGRKRKRAAAGEEKEEKKQK